MNKKVGIYDPYLDTLGEVSDIVYQSLKILTSIGFDVDIFWSGDQDLLSKAQTRYNLNLSGVNLVPDIFKVEPHSVDEVIEPESIIKISSHQHLNSNKFLKITKFIHKYQITKRYDAFFYLSDWSLPFLFSKNNLLHVQVPFVLKPRLKDKILNRLKTLFINKIICNSQFTSTFASQYFGNKCTVLYPPVDISKFSVSKNKKNIILSVGRFDNILNSKKQEIMISSFKKLYSQNKYLDWKLVLAGGSIAQVEDNNFLNHLKHLSQDLPVEFIVNPDFNQLQNIYSLSKIYWHAAGFDIDQNIHPESTEHFGIAPVEAMASGCVPILINKGGLPEVITDTVDGYLWSTEEDLVAKTQLLITMPKLLDTISKAAIVKSNNFSKENFSINLQKYIKT